MRLDDRIISAAVAALILSSHAGDALARARSVQDLRATPVSAAARRTIGRDLVETGKKPVQADIRDVRNPVEVIDCTAIPMPGGETAFVGKDCGLGSGSIPSGGSGSAPGPDSSTGGEEPAEELSGCPYDYFPEDEWFQEDVKFRFPVEDPDWILGEPAVIHMDHDREDGDHHLDCSSFAPWEACYDNHEGTDYSLDGWFWAQDAGSTHAVAAADGVVMYAVDHHFDRCQVDLRPTICTTVRNCVNTPWGRRCVNTPSCRVNDKFGQVVCADGINPDEYDSKPANKVNVCHRDGTITRYLHLMEDSVVVEEGDEVSCGDPLGLIGSSGNSSAPHLHFDVKVLRESPYWNEETTPWRDPYADDPDDSMWVDQDGGAGGLPSTECQ